MTSSSEPIQAQLIAARRNQILAAATKVFAEKGFHATTIKDIANEAGIAHGTIYNYFENKTALMMGIFDRLSEGERHAEYFSQFGGGDFRELMKAYLQRRFTFLQASNSEAFKVVFAEVMVNKELRASFQEKILGPIYAVADVYFQQWAEQGIIKPLDVRLTTRVLSGMILGLIVERIMGDETLESRWNELPDLLVDLILDGLGVPHHDNNYSS